MQPVRGGFTSSWITAAVRPFDAYAVGTLVPVVFAAYARVLHPASTANGTPVRWDVVAAWSGRTAHRLAQFMPLANRAEAPQDPPPFDRQPDTGLLPHASLQALAEVLARHTATPNKCFVGVWEGRGWLTGEDEQAQAVQLPDRLTYLFEGPLDGLDDVGWTHPNGEFVREPPNCFWPEDRAWFVASDVDEDSTYLGGSERLVAELLADPRLEAWPAEPTDPITFDSDSINDGWS